MKNIIRQPSKSKNERPFMIIWETTQACDLACRHCRAEAQPLLHPDALSTEQAKNLLKQAASFGKPSPFFIFTGGDPFKRPDLFELVRYGSDLGLMTAVSPSGTPLLNADNLRKVKESGAKAISLSVDASTAERHDDFRQVQGSFQWTLDGWKAAQDVGLKVQINTTITRYNLHDLPQVFKLVQEMKAMTWSLFFLVPTGRGQSDDEVSPTEYEAVMHFLYDASKFISAKTTEGHHYKRIVLERNIIEEKGLSPEDYISFHPIYYELKAELDKIVKEKGLQPKESIRRTPMHINSGNGFVFISHLGEVFPSGFMPVTGGNVKEKPLADIYRNAELFKTLRRSEALEGRCGRCEFSGVCGGSRSRAYAVTGRPMAEEPFCTYEPGTFPFQSELEERLAMM